MNDELHEDVKAILKLFEGVPYGMAKIALETALRKLERYSFVNVETFDKEFEKNNGGR